jgi:DNA-directed RNA polymerase specialized sigma24 family protein
VNHDPWADALADLAAWRKKRDRAAAHRALGFLEPQLRARVPVRARRRLGGDVTDEGVQSFLEKLLRIELDPEIRHPRAYVVRAFKNHFLDLEETRARLPSKGLHEVADLESALPSPEAVVESAQVETRLHKAIESLAIPDRVALKLADAPEWITDDELRWLANETGRGPAELPPLIVAIESAFDAMEVFEGEAPGDKESSRRHRMERFRRRRARARAKLRAAFEGGGTA